MHGGCVVIALNWVTQPRPVWWITVYHIAHAQTLKCAESTKWDGRGYTGEGYTESDQLGHVSEG